MAPNKEALGQVLGIKNYALSKLMPMGTQLLGRLYFAFCESLLEEKWIALIMQCTNIKNTNLKIRVLTKKLQIFFIEICVLSFLRPYKFLISNRIENR